LIAAQYQHRKMLRSRDLNRTLADAQLEAARAELKRGQSSISLELLKQQIAQADERIKDSELRAPVAGTVLHVLVHEGELVHGQPLVQMANTDKMILQVEVYETDIQHVRVGQKATATSHIFKDADPLIGRVVWKGMYVGRARVTELDPRAEVDKRVIDVKVELERPERVTDLIGHQVHVTIETGPGDDRR
jgi:HlyD family secretion protein